MLQNIDIVETLFKEWRTCLGDEFQAYKNHVYRVINFCTLFRDLSDSELEIISIAACFHDVGIWLDGTFDYIEPSKARALAYLRHIGKPAWAEDVGNVITEHHKITLYGNSDNLVEIFRKSDWLDVSLGVIGWGLDKSLISEVRKTFPNKGFHVFLTKLAIRHLALNPLNPLPMMKW